MYDIVSTSGYMKVLSATTEERNSSIRRTSKRCAANTSAYPVDTLVSSVIELTRVAFPYPYGLHRCVSFRLKARLAELDGLVSDPKLYDDSTRAGKIVKERAQVEASLERVERLPSELQMWREMYGERNHMAQHAKVATSKSRKGPLFAIL